MHLKTVTIENGLPTAVANGNKSVNIRTSAELEAIQGSVNNLYTG